MSKYSDLEALYKISEKRLNLGTITKSDLLQLELSKLNTKVEVNNSKIKWTIACSTSFPIFV